MTRFAVEEELLPEAVHRSFLDAMDSPDAEDPLALRKEYVAKDATSQARMMLGP